jgi:hypothetical protein
VKEVVVSIPVWNKPAGFSSFNVYKEEKGGYT